MKLVTQIVSISMISGFLLGFQHTLEAQQGASPFEVEAGRLEARIAESENPVETDFSAIAQIFKFEHDVTGDGVPELFVSSTLGASRLVNWTVYRGAGNNYTKMAENVKLSPQSFDQKNHEQSVELMNYKVGVDGAFYLYAYEFTGNGQVKDNSRRLTEEETEKIARGEGFAVEGSGKIRPQIEYISLKNFRSKSEQAWNIYNIELSANQQHLSKNEQYRDWTSRGNADQVAQGGSEISTDNQTGKTALQAMKSGDPEGSPEIGALDDGTSNFSGWGGIIALCLAFALVGVYFLKR